VLIYDIGQEFKIYRF